MAQAGYAPPKVLTQNQRLNAEAVAIALASKRYGATFPMARESLRRVRAPDALTYQEQYVLRMKP